MSVISHTLDSNNEVRAQLLKVRKDKDNKVLDEKAEYTATADEKAALGMILRDFTKGYVNLHTPRVEFNDMSVVDRYQYDMMAFNSYQSNNGEPYANDSLSGWRSRAMRPVVRLLHIAIISYGCLKTTKSQRV